MDQHPTITRRLELQTKLEEILGCRQVFFQPPETLQMSYPAIVYVRDDEATAHADNKPYNRRRRYLVTVMDYDPDSLIPEAVADLPSANFVRAFAADQLNHSLYTLYF